MTNDLKDTNDDKKKNVATRELNDNIDHKNVVTILYQLMVADEVKYFSLEHAQKKTMFSIFDTRVYF